MQNVARRVNRRRPGRPIRGVDIRKRILDAGERRFAENGYSGTSLRDVANRAGVNQALITYYFGSKLSFFEAVFKRRGLEIAQRRIELIDALEAKPKRPPKLRQLIEAYLQPQFEMKRSGPAGLAFVTLQARLHTEPEELAFRLRREVYDASTKRYIAALEKALPQVDPADISFRMMFLIGTYLYMLSGVDRLADLSDDRFTSRDLDALVTRMVDFLESGFMAPSSFARVKRKRAPSNKESA